MGTHVAFIFSGYEGFVWGFKTFILHGFGVQGNEVVYTPWN